LQPGELLANPKAHVSSKSFDPQPGQDDDILVGRAHAPSEFRSEELRA
jgi:hypothetical protein